MDDPGGLDPVDFGRSRDLGGLAAAAWVRPAILLLLGVPPVLALLNLFGQHPETSIHRARAATLRVAAPDRVRGGLIYQVRFDVLAHRRLRQPTLMLSPGWFQSLTLNSTMPQAADERSTNGWATLRYSPLPAGGKLTVWAYFQANPDNLGRQRQIAVLLDGRVRLATIRRTLTLFP